MCVRVSVRERERRNDICLDIDMQVRKTQEVRTRTLERNTEITIERLLEKPRDKQEQKRRCMYREGAETRGVAVMLPALAGNGVGKEGQEERKPSWASLPGVWLGALLLPRPHMGRSHCPSAHRSSMQGEHHEGSGGDSEQDSSRLQAPDC